MKKNKELPPIIIWGKMASFQGLFSNEELWIPHPLFVVLLVWNRRLTVGQYVPVSFFCRKGGSIWYKTLSSFDSLRTTGSGTPCRVSPIMTCWPSTDLKNWMKLSECSKNFSNSLLDNSITAFMFCGLKKTNLISFAHSTESGDKNGGIIIPPNLSPDCVKGAIGQIVVRHGDRDLVNTAVSREDPLFFASEAAISNTFFLVPEEFSWGKKVLTVIPKPDFPLEDEGDSEEPRKYSENDCFAPFFLNNPGGEDGFDCAEKTWRKKILISHFLKYDRVIKKNLPILFFLDVLLLLFLSRKKSAPMMIKIQIKMIL